MFRRAIGRALEFAAVGAMLASAIMAITVVVLVLEPYYPLRFDSLGVQDEVCVDDEATVEVDYTIDPELYETIRVMEIHSEWVAVDVEGFAKGSRRFAAETHLYPEQLKSGRNARQGLAVRVSPERPGVWVLENEYTVRANRPVLPPTQTVKFSADETTDVLPEDSPQCS